MNNEGYQCCRLCPRDCRVDRTAGEKGYCGESAVCRIASAIPHFGEEPSFTGTKGSGTIFFAGCSSRCFFCQNHQISSGAVGRDVTPEQLLEAALELLGKGVHNLNFVSPDHFWPHVERVCRQLRDRGVLTPFLFNGSGYQRPERVPEYAEVFDIFLPDFKFADPELAQACMNDARYPELALDSLRSMVAHKGFLFPWDPQGEETASRGVLVRHLVLPGQVENSLAVIRLLHREIGPGLPLSIMSQFRPMPGCREHGMLERGVATGEYARVVDLVEDLEFECAYIQPESGDRDFLPDFTRNEPFEGNLKRG